MAAVWVAGSVSAHAALTVVSNTTWDSNPADRLNTLLFQGTSGDPANSDTYRVDDSQDQTYAFPSSAVSTLLLEIAGNKNGNAFGIYDPSDPSNSSKRIQLFSGPDGAVTTKSVTFDSGAKTITVGSTVKTYGAASFGFYLSGPGGTFYSQPSLNDGKDNLITFDNWTVTTLRNTPGATALKNSSGGNLFDRILAWEDLKLKDSDKDYNDMLIGLSLTVVPEPGTMLAGGLVAGLAGLHFVRSRRRTELAK